ncbi:MAG: single-stranded-DNA-specific exonuclease RecJ, partial [Candidatus Jacksonbacteria bacterium]|nr:single-stranded-DNA-specific exonuclease RecJ [Candidatus Jacksonbacteria bacterium]
MLYHLEPQPPPEFFSQNQDFHPALLSILWQRNVKTREDIEEFLLSRYSTDLYDPFKFQEMKKTVERLRAAASKKERVIIYGDYDVDGVTASILMLEALEKLYNVSPEPRFGINGSELLSVYLPHREDEGYGLNPGAVSYIKSRGATLLITCDCGSGNTEELTELKLAGIDVIILDHHVAPKDRPPCYGFINPKFEKETYPFRGLAGCGVVFKVIQALRLSANKAGLSDTADESVITEAIEKWSLDLVALATVADMMPLVKENRVLVKWGLVVLNKTKRIGLRALIRGAGLLERKITAEDIAYALAPRINAAGRLDHANVAFDLLRQNSPERAEVEANNLNKTNTARQTLTEKILKEAKKQVSDQLKNEDKILVAHNFANPAKRENVWKTGVIGLVAGKLAKEYNRPSFVIGRANHGLAGSGRSIPGFDLIASLASVSDLLEKYGGHPQACGFTLKSEENPENAALLFKSRVEEYARDHLSDDLELPETSISCELPLSGITWDLMNAISKLEPFGQENPVPIFLTRGARVLHVRAMGKDNNHCKLAVEQNGVVCEAVAFRAEDHVKETSEGEIRDLVYTLAVNEWN